MGGELDVGCRAGAAALRNHIAGTPFALAALGGNSKFELDFVKAQAGPCMTGNFTVGDSAADTDDHGIGLLEVNRWIKYKCESVAFAIKT
jgi:hypothetical protein